MLPKCKTSLEQGNIHFSALVLFTVSFFFFSFSRYLGEHQFSSDILVFQVLLFCAFMYNSIYIARYTLLSPTFSCALQYGFVWEVQSFITV